MILRKHIALPQGLLSGLRPNDYFESIFRAGYRKAVARERGFRREPSDLFDYQRAPAHLRAFVRAAFGGTTPPSPVGLLFVGLYTHEPADDDAFVLLVKPVLDGLTDAWGWSKDRRRVGRIAGTVVREAQPGVLVEVSP